MARNQTSNKHEEGLKLAGILFADIKNFSKLSQAQLEKFVEVILSDLATVLDRYRSSLMELNTWGDAIVAVSEDPVKLARLALDVRDYFRTTNFEAAGLPGDLKSRISLHAGTVKYGRDPIRKRAGVIGGNVNLAARIEPIIVPGEVWATIEFAQMLQPHAHSERLAFDDLGALDLAKQFGVHRLVKLRRHDEPHQLSTVAADELRARRAHTNLGNALDVVGIGALNTDYIATATHLRKINPEVVSDNERFFELGRERQVGHEQVRKVINEIGASLLTVSLGGSSFNTIHALAYALPELRLAYVGVAGRTEAEIDFVGALKSLGVDISCVGRSSGESGLCVSYITRGERSLLTAPGANIEMARHLEENRSVIVPVSCIRNTHESSLPTRNQQLALNLAVFGGATPGGV